MTSLFSTLLTDALNRAQTNTWQDYSALTAMHTVNAPEEPDDGLPPRGLSDDEELRRMGYDQEEVDQVGRLLRGEASGISYGS